MAYSVAGPGHALTPRSKVRSQYEVYNYAASRQVPDSTSNHGLSKASIPYKFGPCKLSGDGMQ